MLGIGLADVGRLTPGRLLAGADEAAVDEELDPADAGLGEHLDHDLHFTEDHLGGRRLEDGDTDGGGRSPGRNQQHDRQPVPDHQRRPPELTRIPASSARRPSARLETCRRLSVTVSRGQRL